MTFAAVDQIENIDIHQFLKIYQMNGFTRNLSENSDMWQYISKLKEMDPTARYLKYLLIDELGYGAVQPVAADGGAYPAARRSNLQEASARYKEWAWTVDVPRVLENKTGSDLMQYAKPLATELDNKQIAYARLKCIELQGDGTGAIGIATAVPTVSSGKLVVTISNTSANAGRSSIRWFQEGDLVRAYGPDASTVTYDGTLVAAYYKITNVDEDNYQVTLQGYNSSNVAVTADGSNTLAAADVIYRLGVTANDLGDYDGTTDESENLSENMVGLEGLLNAGGSLVHGIARTGAIKGTRRDLGGVTIDTIHFQRALSKLKVKAGKGRYTYPNAFMNDKTYDTLVEAREVDRRFHSIEDTDRGVKGIGYVHGRDKVEFMPDEFVHEQRIWILPQGKGALCYAGSDPKQVKPNGNDPFHLTTSTSGAGYGRDQQTFFEQTGVLLTKHPAACGVIENFAASE